MALCTRTVTTGQTQGSALGPRNVSQVFPFSSNNHSCCLLASAWIQEPGWPSHHQLPPSSPQHGSTKHLLRL